MSDIRDVHNAVRTDLERRRELAAMSKPELISHTIDVERRLESQTASRTR